MTPAQCDMPRRCAWLKIESLLPSSVCWIMMNGRLFSMTRFWHAHAHTSVRSSYSNSTEHKTQHFI